MTAKLPVTVELVRVDLNEPKKPFFGIEAFVLCTDVTIFLEKMTVEKK